MWFNPNLFFYLLILEAIEQLFQRLEALKAPVNRPAPFMVAGVRTKQGVKPLPKPLPESERARQLHGVPKPQWEQIRRRAYQQMHRRLELVRHSPNRIVRTTGATTSVTVGHYTLSGPTWLMKRLRVI